MDALKEFLFFAGRTPVADNVRLSEDEQEIAASRFVLQSSASADALADSRMLAELRRLCRRAPFAIVVYNPYFPFVDQYLQVLPTTYKSLALSFAAVLIVTALLLPGSLTAAATVALSVASIETFVVASMTLMDINLDVVSMIILIMGVGLSVDFSAHVANHFARSKLLSVGERLRDCLEVYASPVSKSAASTALGVLPLLALDSYILCSFARVTLVVVAAGFLHGLVLLPVALSILARLPSRLRQVNGQANGMSPPSPALQTSSSVGAAAVVAGGE